MSSRVFATSRLIGTVVLLFVSICWLALAQNKNSAFDRLRELPALGACPIDGSAPDPDLRKALSSAVTQARAEAANALDSIARMKDLGLTSPDALRQLSESAAKLSEALRDPDPCLAARRISAISPDSKTHLPTSGSEPEIHDNSEGVRSFHTEATPFKLAANRRATERSARTSDNHQLELVEDAAGDSPAGDTETSNKGAPRAKITISTDTLDFGHQSMQTASESKPVTVTNNNDKKLNLRVITSTGLSRNFQISGCQNPLDKGEQCTFNVTFTPYPEKRMRERFLAVVSCDTTGQTCDDADTFEKLREALSIKESQVDRAEDVWRVAARCADESLLKRDSDCPTRLGLIDETNQDHGGVATDKDSGEVCSRDPKEYDPITPDEVNKYKNKTFANYVSRTAQQTAKKRFACYAYRRSEAAKIEQDLRSEFNVITLRAVSDHWKFPFTRGVVGVDMSAPTSNTVKQSYFVDFNLIAPMKIPFVKKNEDPLENRFWMWLNPRITSLPQATNFSAVSTINETGSFFDQVSNGKLNDIANGLDVNGGLEFALVKPRDGIPWWSEYVNTQARLSPSLIFGVGVSTPFSTNDTEVRSNVTQAICDAFKAPSGQTVSDANGLICGVLDGKSAVKVTPNPDIPNDNGLRPFIDFYTPDRSRFFRRYYAGFRLKTYFFSKDVHSYCKPFEQRASDEGDCSAPYDVFPGIIDLTFGRDEAVTAGHLDGWLFRIDSVYPLPWVPGLHVFGSIYTKLARNRADQPFTPYTLQKPADGAATDLNTFRFGLHPLDRDYFRIGVGVDLLQLLKRTGQPKKDAPPAPTNGN